MLKSILSLVLGLTLVTSGLFAQSAKGNGKSDPEAKKVLDAVISVGMSSSHKTRSDQSDSNLFHINKKLRPTMRITHLNHRC